MDELGLQKERAILPAQLTDRNALRNVLQELANQPDEFRPRYDLEEARARSISIAELLVKAIKGEKDEVNASPISAALSGFRRSA